MGSANTRLRRFGPSLAGALLVGPLFRIHGARPWLVRLLCQMGLFWMCYTGSDVLCISVVSSAFFSCYSRFLSLQSTVHQSSWNLLEITPTTTVDAHFLCFYAGIDGKYFALKDRQHSPPGSSGDEHWHPRMPFRRTDLPGVTPGL